MTHFQDQTNIGLLYVLNVATKLGTILYAVKANKYLVEFAKSTPNKGYNTADNEFQRLPSADKVYKRRLLALWKHYDPESDRVCSLLLLVSRE